MQIELRRISYSAALSQETAAFSAEVWIEGELAFHARNQGTGGADFYHQVGRWTVAEVDAWLKANRPVRTLDENLGCDHDLEIEVADLLARELESRRLKRLLRTNLLTIEIGRILQYPLRKRSPAPCAPPIPPRSSSTTLATRCSRARSTCFSPAADIPGRRSS